MEQFLDALLAFLVANVNVAGIGTGNPLNWIIGDPGMGAPPALPYAYVIPLWDNVQPLSNGVDTDTYVIPLLVVDDLHRYGPPVANVNVAGAFEQPGYRVLMQYGQAVRTALRAGGRAITVEGIAATSQVPAITYVWVRIDNKPYRGVRISFVVQQRRNRAG